MLTIEERIKYLTRLGEKINHLLIESQKDEQSELHQVMSAAFAKNGWFTIENQRYALQKLTEMLQADALHRWAQSYAIPANPSSPRRVGVVMAGNIPLVNFHDFLAVLITGHRFVGKLSSSDPVLLPYLSKILIGEDSRWQSEITFTDGSLRDFDAIIATGSDNTSRYFDYYFSKHPHIIRKNRTSVAVFSGEEDESDLALLADDVFRYFGLGCRNVSKIFIPKQFDPTVLFQSFSAYAYIINHHKYHNNYDYQKAICLVNKDAFLDSGWLLMKYSTDLFSPVSMIFLEEYDNLTDCTNRLIGFSEKLQCVVSKAPCSHLPVVAPGQSQSPGLTDYPDGVDLVQFLLNL